MADGAAKARVLDWLGEIGPRWGLPAVACRVHGCIYLAGRAMTAAELAGALSLPPADVDSALVSLREIGVVHAAGDSAWATRSDPWELVMIALERRRAEELEPALAVLRTSKAGAVGDPVLAGQIGKLLALVEDVAAISDQAQRLPPGLLRGLLGAGGRLARLTGGRR